MELQCALTEAQEQEYDDSVKLWQVGRYVLFSALLTFLFGAMCRTVCRWALQRATCMHARHSSVDMYCGWCRICAGIYLRRWS